MQNTFAKVICKRPFTFAGLQTPIHAFSNCKAKTNKKMKKQYQIQFHQFVAELMKNENPNLEMYQLVIGMVYTLIEEDRLQEIDEILRVHFPNYYSSTIPFIFSEN